MGWAGGIVLYVLIWWGVLFTVLPWGVRGQFEDGDVVSGTEPGAPVRASLSRRVLMTSGIAALVWGAAYLVVTYEIITLTDLGFPPLREQ